ncbi:MAG: hypothetical protein M1826_004756 [Phylliscum demangeonii]|nr:MAG: hypothetical protein M1826_004756 [Phylliscum demangeonii]
MTIKMVLPFPNIFIEVRYLSTTTSTSSVNCHGCSAVVLRNIGGTGPPRHPTTTITSTLSTVTTFKCAASATPSTAKLTRTAA